jgi:hypothetical protein
MSFITLKEEDVKEEKYTITCMQGIIGNKHIKRFLCLGPSRNNNATNRC